MKKINKIAIGILIGLGVDVYCTAMVPKAVINIQNRIEHSDAYLCENAYNKLPKSFQFFLDKNNLSIVFVKKGGELDAKGILGLYRNSSDNNIVIYKTGYYDEDLNTLIHEMAHHFDYDLLKKEPMRVSGRADFMKVCIEERDNIFTQDSPFYENNEYFAWAVAEFYTNNNNLKENCPKTYKWIKHNIDEPEDSYCNYDEYERNYLNN